jgi:spore coat protein CotH
LKKNAASGGGRRRGPRGGGSRPKGTPGPKVDPSAATSFSKATLYDPSVLRTIFLNFESDDWEAELAAFKPTDVEVPAEMIVDGEKYPNVGVSFRGASSFFMIPAGSKRSFNISTDFMDKDQRLYGVKSLNLLNGNGDASMMSSALYSHFASKNIPTPKVNFVKVVVNGESWGVYVNAEQFNKDFLKEHFDTKSGARWKVSGSPRGDGGLRYLGEDVEKYRERFELKSKEREEDWKALIGLCKVLDETPTDQLEEALKPILDVEGVLWFLAYDVAFINSDGYWTRASDYSIYKDPSDKFHVIPHDMNESFRPMRQRGRRGPPQQERQASNPSGFELDPMIGLDNERFPLRSKLLAVPAFQEKYLRNLRKIAKDYLGSESFDPLVEKMRKLAEEEVYADTRKLMTNDAFKSATETGADGKGLVEFARKRAEYLLNHPKIKELKDD